MNAMILLAQGAMNMADSLATANPVLTEVNAPEMNMLDMAIKGWLDYDCAGCVVRSLLLHLVRT